MVKNKWKVVQRCLYSYRRRYSSLQWSKFVVDSLGAQHFNHCDDEYRLSIRVQTTLNHFRFVNFSGFPFVTALVMAVRHVCLKCGYKQKIETHISFLHHSFHGNTWAQQIDPLPTEWLRNSVGRASHRHRRGHGFDSRWSSLKLSRVYMRLGGITFLQTSAPTACSRLTL